MANHRKTCLCNRVNVNPISYLIYSPFSSQALTIASFLRKYCSGAELVGVLSHNEFRLGWNRLYKNFITIDSVKYETANGVKIPTGAIVTQYCLEQGDVTLGSVTLKQPMLKVFDKPWMISQASASGVPVPMTWGAIEEISNYPIFYKQRYEGGGGKRGIANSIHDLPVCQQGDLIYQELINSPGTYGVSFLADKGYLLAVHTHFERASIPKEGGSAVFIERFEDARLINYTSQLIKSLDYSGWGLAEFKFCPHRNDYVFMEINAKFWASCQFTFMNEPLFLKLLFDIDSIESKVERMVFLDRALSRGLIFTMKNLNYLWGEVKIHGYSEIFRSLANIILPIKVKRFLKQILLYSNKSVI